MYDSVLDFFLDPAGKTVSDGDLSVYTPQKQLDTLDIPDIWVTTHPLTGSLTPMQQWYEKWVAPNIPDSLQNLFGGAVSPNVPTPTQKGSPIVVVGALALIGVGAYFVMKGKR